ncbi:MAG: rod shape-determining protein MreC [Prochlorotrichaceae cyanobacterium]
MYSLNRWWEQYGSRLLVISTVLAIGWFLRQTQGAFLLELYASFARLFQPQTAQEEWLMEARFLELQERLIELDQQNQQLRSLLGDPDQPLPPDLFAPVVGRSVSEWWQQTLVGRGSSDGIKEGSIAMAPGGLVGRVTQTTPHSSRVTLISDPMSSVGVMVSRTRSQGYIRGQASNQVIMRFFEKTPDVRPGDVITTSPNSTLFPPGLPVGVVETIQMKASPSPQAIIRLTAPISRLEWVSISHYTPPVLPDPPKSPAPASPTSP